MGDCATLLFAMHAFLFYAKIISPLTMYCLHVVNFKYNVFPSFRILPGRAEKARFYGTCQALSLS